MFEFYFGDYSLEIIYFGDYYIWLLISSSLKDDLTFCRAMEKKLKQKGRKQNFLSLWCSKPWQPRK